MPGPAACPLVGRAAELGVLADAVRAVVSGQGRPVWIEGEPGIGKSRLLDAGLAGAADLGCEVHRGAGDELHQRLPLHAMLDWLEEEPAAPGAGAAPPVGLWAVGDSLPLLTEQLVALIDRRTSRAAQIVAIDDLQWVDDASLLVLTRLVRLAGQAPLLVVTASRPTPRRGAANPLRREVVAAGGVVISLDSLPDGDATVLAGRLAGGPVGPRLAALAAKAAGNPLYLRELVEGLRREGALVGGPEGTDLAAGAAPGSPPSLRAAVTARLTGLSGPAVDLLSTAALLGVGFAVADLLTVLGWPVMEVMAAINEAIEAGLLVDAGNRLEFRHPIIWETLYETLPAKVRAVRHVAAARALAGAGGAAESVAAHLLASQAGDAGPVSAWLVSWLTGAGDQLFRRAPESAVDLLERAADRLGADRRGEQLELLLARMRFRLGRSPDVTGRLPDVLPRVTDPARSAELRWILAASLQRLGQPAEAQQVLTSLREAAPAGPWPARGMALQALTMSNFDVDRAAELALAARAEGERIGDRFTCGMALHALSVLAAYRADILAVLDLTGQVIEVFQDDPEFADLCLAARYNRILAWHSVGGRDAEAEADLRSARAFAERTGSGRITAITLAAAEFHFRAGNWDAALAELDTVAEDAASGHVVALFVRHGLGALIEAHRDRRRAAAAYLRPLRGRSIAVAEERNNAGYLLMARAVVAEQAGAVGEAAATLASMLDGYSEASYLRSLWLPDLVRLALAGSDPKLAARAAETAAAHAERDPSPAWRAAADCSAAILAGDPDRLLAVAAEHYRGQARPRELGSVLEEAAVALAGCGRLAQARTVAAEAREAYGTLSANWDDARLAHRLAQCGIRQPPRARSHRPATGWDALSGAERRIATLVGQGMSNPDIAAALFVSRRTVESHVSRLMVKLAARSRVDVVRESLTHTG
jgi:DNA-binding CsgD family transcriptional regulator